ncbi:NAD(P)-dependent alcohol dehydrogenase [Kitasatospora paranensis]
MVKPTRVTNTIRALRFTHGEMTQAALADRIGVTRQTVIAIEQGRYSPSLEMAFQIARVFGVPLDDVFQYPDTEGEHREGHRPAPLRRTGDPRPGEADRPVPGDHEVLIRVHAAGVDPGVWHLTAGMPYAVRLGFGLRAPRQRIPGADVAGRVEAVGREVTGLRPGDEVFGTGTGAFAEYACARQDRLAVKPAALTWEKAAALPTSGVTALQGLRDAGRLTAGQHVLVIGAAGGVGSLAVQLAKAMGGEVTGVCSGAKTGVVRSLGADHTIDYTREDALDGRRRYDLVLDTAGNRPLHRLRGALTPRGTLVIVGGERGGRLLQGSDRQMRALLLSAAVPQRLRGLMAVPRQPDLQYLAQAAADGRLDPLLDRTYPLREAALAVRHVHDGHATGKTVLTVAGQDGPTS